MGRHHLIKKQSMQLIQSNLNSEGTDLFRLTFDQL